MEWRIGVKKVGGTFDHRVLARVAILDWRTGVKKGEGGNF